MSTEAAAFQPDRFAGWFARVLGNDEVPCTGVRFRPDGRLGLAFRVSGRSVGLVLGPATDPGVPAPCGSIAPADPADPLAEPLSRAAARRVERLVQRVHVPLLDLFSPSGGESALTFGPGLFQERIGSFLVPMVTTWGRFRYEGEKYDGDRLTYGFASAWAEVQVELRLDPDAAGATFRSPHLSARVVRDDRAPADRDDPANRPEDFLAFLWSRCDGPGTRIEAMRRGRVGSVDSSVLEWGARLDVQFFHEEPGHDFLAIFNAWFALRGPVAFVTHGERECACMAVLQPVPYSGFVPSRLRVTPWNGLASRAYVSDLRDADAVMGGEDRLKEAVDTAQSQPGVDLVVVMPTCLARVIGDDVGGCLRDRARPGGPQLLDMDSSRQENVASFYEIQRFWRDIVESRSDAAAPREPRSVNLVGFGLRESPEVQELTALLGQAGLSVGACLFPGLDWDDAARFDRAAVAVVHPWFYVGEAYELIDARGKVPSTRPPAPHGLAGTSRWLRGVLDAAGLADAPAPGPSPEVADRFAQLRERAAGTSIAFVIASTQAHSLLDETRSHGIRIPEALAEMGFGLSVLVFDPPEVRTDRGRTDPAEIEARVRQSAGPGAAVRLEVFRDRGELAALLAGPGHALVWSEVRLDPRVQAAGKGQCGPADLLLGYQGAVRTAERLLRRASRPLRGPFGRHLAGGR